MGPDQGISKAPQIKQEAMNSDKNKGGGGEVAAGLSEELMNTLLPCWLGLRRRSPEGPWAGVQRAEVEAPRHCPWESWETLTG